MKHKEDSKAWTENDHAANEKEALSMMEHPSR